jgi:hypothetical protein
MVCSGLTVTMSRFLSLRMSPAVFMAASLRQMGKKIQKRPIPLFRQN